MLRTKFWISSLAFLAMLICSSSAYSQTGIFISEPGAPSTSVTTQTLGIGPSEPFSVAFFGFAAVAVPDVDTLNFTFDPALPIVDVTGAGFFSGATSVFTPANLSASSLTEASLSLAAVASPNAGDLIAEISFDTTGFSEGDEISFDFDASFFNGDVEVPTSTLEFGFTVVPEPCSAGVLFALGSIVMMRRKRA